MKKFFAVVLIFVMTIISVTVSAKHEPPLYSGLVYEVIGLIYHNAHFEYDDKIQIWGHYDFKNKSNKTCWRIYFGNNTEKNRKSKDNFIGLVMYDDDTVDSIEYAYVFLNDIADDPNPKQRLSNGQIAFNLLCRAIGMNSTDINGLWNQLGNYYSSTNHNFPEKDKTFYQRCPSIREDVYFSLEPLDDGNGLLLILGRVTN